MSLINDLLRDLDARHAPRPGNALSAGEPLCSAAQTERALSGLPGLLVAGLLIAAGAAGGWFYLSNDSSSSAVPRTPSDLPQQKVPVAASEAAEEGVSIPLAPVAGTPAPGGLTDPTAIRLPAQAPASGPSGLTAGKPAEREDAVPKQEMAVAVAVATDAAPVTRSRPAAVRPAASIRRPHVASVEELDRKTLSRAREMLRAGGLQRAEGLLRARLAETPRANASRELLTGMLIQQGRFAEAGRVAEEGLEIDPDQPALHLRLARVLISQGDAAGAIAALQAVPHEETDTADYLGMLAVSTQKLGDHVAATALYRGLLERFPPQANWWVGLAVSLEASRMPQEAEAAYREGARLSGEHSGLRRFANERIAALAQVGES